MADLLHIASLKVFSVSIEQLNYKNLTEIWSIAVIDNFEQYHSTAGAFEVNIIIGTT